MAMPLSEKTQNVVHKRSCQSDRESSIPLVSELGTAGCLPLSVLIHMLNYIPLQGLTLAKGLNRRWSLFLSSPAVDKGVWAQVHTLAFPWRDTSEACIRTVLDRCQQGIRHLSFEQCLHVNDHTLIFLSLKLLQNLESIRLAFLFRLTASVVEDVVRACPKLTGLHLLHCSQGLTTRVLKQMVWQKGPQLTSLTLGGSRVTDSVIKNIARRCGSLRSLELHGCNQVGGEALRDLLEKVPLHTLRLLWCLELDSSAFRIRSSPPAAPPAAGAPPKSEAGTDGSTGAATTASAPEGDPPVDPVKVHHPLHTLEIRTNWDGRGGDYIAKLALHFPALQTLAIQPVWNVSSEERAELLQGCPRLTIVPANPNVSTSTALWL